MKKEPQLFTSLQRQRKPVSASVLNALENEEVTESLLREIVRKKMRLIVKRARVF